MRFTYLHCFFSKKGSNISFHIFSFVCNGLGMVLCCLGIIFFNFIFHYNLHTMNEPEISEPWTNWSFFSSIKFLVALLVGFSFLATIIFHQERNIIMPYLNVLCIMSIVYIIVPKYFTINKNHNLKLYVSVYHHQPPFVLPWQIPDNFDPNSVKVIQ